MQFPSGTAQHILSPNNQFYITKEMLYTCEI